MPASQVTLATGTGVSLASNGKQPWETITCQQLVRCCIHVSRSVLRPLCIPGAATGAARIPCISALIIHVFLERASSFKTFNFDETSGCPRRTSLQRLEVCTSIAWRLVPHHPTRSIPGHPHHWLSAVHQHRDSNT